MSTAKIIQQCFETKKPVRLGAMTGAQFKTILKELKTLTH